MATVVAKLISMYFSYYMCVIRYTYIHTHIHTYTDTHSQKLHRVGIFYSLVTKKIELLSDTTREIPIIR